ncbi:hypothetical protein [Albirhodobacter sp. R86504]|uniref:hypothetical protein n=1 Tax=Albirhodobacter sp. R86504 TaxID=3093848 RepID=UPI003671E5EF
MNERSGKKQNAAAAEREARLKAALRANLQRRKAQTRGRADDDAGAGCGETDQAIPITPRSDEP